MHSNWPTSVTSGELGITVCLYHLGVSLMSVTSVCDAVGGFGLECPLEGQGSESHHTVSDTPEWSLKPPHTRASGHLCPIYTATCERQKKITLSYVLKVLKLRQIHEGCCKLHTEAYHRNIFPEKSPFTKQKKLFCLSALAKQNIDVALSQ